MNESNILLHKILSTKSNKYKIAKAAILYIKNNQKIENSSEKPAINSLLKIIIN